MEGVLAGGWEWLDLMWLKGGGADGNLGGERAGGTDSKPSIVPLCL